MHLSKDVKMIAIMIASKSDAFLFHTTPRNRHVREVRERLILHPSTLVQATAGAGGRLKVKVWELGGLDSSGDAKHTV